MKNKIKFLAKFILVLTFVYNSSVAKSNDIQYQYSYSGQLVSSEKGVLFNLPTTTENVSSSDCYYLYDTIVCPPATFQGSKVRTWLGFGHISCQFWDGGTSRDTGYPVDMTTLTYDLSSDDYQFDSTCQMYDDHTANGACKMINKNTGEVLQCINMELSRKSL